MSRANLQKSGIQLFDKNRTSICCKFALLTCTPNELSDEVDFYPAIFLECTAASQRQAEVSSITYFNYGKLSALLISRQKISGDLEPFFDTNI